MRLGPHALDVIAQTPSVRIGFRWRYQGLEDLLGVALGYMPAAFPQALGGGAYRHLYEVSADLASEPWPSADSQPLGTRLVRRGTFAAWRQVSVWQVLSGMVQSLALVSDGERVQGDVVLVGETLSRTSAVNTTTTLQALPPCGWPLVSVRHGRLRLGPRSATVPLTAAHDVCYRTLEVRSENNLAATAGPRTGLAPEEYTRTQPPHADAHVRAATLRQRCLAGCVGRRHPAHGGAGVHRAGDRRGTPGVSPDLVPAGAAPHGRAALAGRSWGCRTCSMCFRRRCRTRRLPACPPRPWADRSASRWSAVLARIHSRPREQHRSVSDPPKNM